MAYYLDTCSGHFEEFANDELSDAKEKAELAIAAARDFSERMGFAPFWANAVEIRKGKPGLGKQWNGLCESRNQEIVENTKPFKRYGLT